MPSPVFWLFSVPLLAGWLWAAVSPRRRDPEGARVLAAVVLSAMAVYPLGALARHYGVVAFSRAQATFGGRFGWIPAVLALLLLWQWLAQPRRTRLQRTAASGLLAWSTFCILHEPYYQPPRPPLTRAGEWYEQAATIDAALDARKAGTLQEPVIIKRVLCRPTEPPGVWRIRRLTIAPRR
jgi:hypothetical protein